MNKAYRLTLSLFASTTMIAVASCMVPYVVLAKESPSGWVEDDNPKPVAPKVIKGADGKVTLQGGVQHSADLPPLPDKWKVGSIFNEKDLPDTRKQEDWYQIPDWFAGQWLREEETVISTYQFSSHQQNNQQKAIAVKEIADFGVQRDKDGHIWHYRLATKGVGDKGGTMSVALILSEEPMEVDEKKVVLKDVFIEMQVDKGSNAIFESSQAESISTYSLWKDDLIRTAASIKFFNQDGSPRAEQHNISFEKRIAAFKPEDTWKGQNLKAEFAAFLHSVGKDSLIPKP